MKRIAVVDNEKLKDMQLKLHIQKLCPINRTGTECIKLEQTKLFIDELTCIGCGICVKAAPDAIRIINLPQELHQDPIFRYGKNSFALYSLPVPVFGQIVGIIGRNGIGKSTAISLLAGLLRPNFGHWDATPTDKEIINYFKGTQAQAYFERLYGGKIKISYKPQQVELIQKQYKGKVKDLLARVDENNNLRKVAQALDLLSILDHDLASVSGGELQRIAIAGAALKSANVYIFDEPTSYLDIKQRLNVTSFIRSLVNEQTAVLLVEHDLIVLDYLADTIHITYGKEQTYGVVSQPKAAKTGINTYLGGYLKEENVRFRDKQVHFAKRPPFIQHKTPVLLSWQGIQKTFFTSGKQTFHLQAMQGSVLQGEVVGIIGENGIGKTTFVKLLAGILEPDQGSLTFEQEKKTLVFGTSHAASHQHNTSHTPAVPHTPAALHPLVSSNPKFHVSYKSQYLEPNDALVGQVLHAALA
ncbi:MAG: ribosome biogenesis/translation initiation ATPase RLI, partial [Candidatus Woesearchaeota archaeon]